MFVGFNVTFMPMQFLGAMGMVRRIYTYDDLPGWSTLNTIATGGAYLQAIGVFVFIANVVISIRAKVPAGDNPWDGFTLEWATSSPPPELNFKKIPPVFSERPTWDMNHAEAAKGTQR